MSNRYLIDIRKDQNNNSEVSIGLYSPLLIISNRQLNIQELDTLSQCCIIYDVIVSNEKYEDILFIESLKDNSLKPVCVNTGRVVSSEINIIDYKGGVFGASAISRLNVLRDNIASSSMSSHLKYNLGLYINLLDNLSQCDERFISKDSFFECHESWNRKDESYFEMLNLIEFDKLRSFYDENIFSSYLCTTKLRERKISSLNQLFDLRNNGDIHFNKKDDFPTALKLLSVMYIKASQFKLSCGVLSSSFMFAFRALEVYCDGLLVYYDIAHLGNALRRNGDIFKENTLLVDNKFVSGFGSKWNKIKEQNEFTNIPSGIVLELDNIANLRNNFLLAHGNVRVTKNICESAILAVVSFITSFETEINQQLTKWSDVSDKVEGLLFFDMVDEINFFCDEIVS